jgi:DNA primase catalytic core, N-terminal domain
MINRRTLLKTFAAVGFGSVFTPKLRYSAALPFDGWSCTVDPTRPSVQQSNGLLSNLMPIERWENLTDDLDCVELMTRYESLKEAFLYERTALDLAWKAECPFCMKSDSLRVSIDGYRCDTCKSCGSAIDFYSKIEGVPVAEAASSLEAMLESGELTGQRTLREHGWEIMAEAERFYHKLLLECSSGAGAKRWLAGRGIGIKTIATFGMGYAPVRPGGLLSHHLLLKQGYSFRALSGASVMCHDNGVLSDRFSGILIPIHDQQGRCYGFMESNPGFRYISREWIQRTTCIAPRRYRRLVFPAPSWPEDFHKFDTVLIAESLADVLALHSAGVPNAVHLIGLEPYALRSALAVGKTVIYPWYSQHEHRVNVDDLLEKVGCQYSKVRLLRVPDSHSSLAEMLRVRGADAVRCAMKDAIPISGWLGT